MYKIADLKRVIVAGKGGSGKTTFVASLLRYLLDYNPKLRILLIDADNSPTFLTKFKDIKGNVENLEALGALKESFDSDELQKCVTKLVISEGVFDYAFMGSHLQNSCLCGYNNTLSKALDEIEASGEHDLIIIDREAGVEHINRHVYKSNSDLLVTLSWPTDDYLAVAERINSLADILGSTPNRLLVINNIMKMSVEPEIEEHYQKIVSDKANIVEINDLNDKESFKKAIEGVFE